MQTNLALAGLAMSGIGAFGSGVLQSLWATSFFQRKLQMSVSFCLYRAVTFQMTSLHAFLRHNAVPPRNAKPLPPCSLDWV